MFTGGLTPAEESLLLDLLGNVEQLYSSAFFKALTGLLPVVGCEAVVMRKKVGRLEVLMTRRPDDDVNMSWAGKWQSPGTILRA